MSEPVALWARMGVITAVSVGLLLTLVPERPRGRVGWGVGAALGACLGFALFCAVTRSRPRLRQAGVRARVACAKLALLGLLAANEEVLWRRVALGELLRVGAAPALVASSAGFALVHRRRRAVHLGTGGAFGAVYLGTGTLVASVAAHWTYNALVGAFVAARAERGRPG